MRIAMIGTGYVGLVSGACFSDFGHDVICVDTDTAKIAQLQSGVMPIFEPGLDMLVARNVEAGRLSFSTGSGAAVRSADAVFLAVGTPSRRGDGFADLSFIYAAAQAVAAEIADFTVVATKSTVPVGTNDEIEAIIRKLRPDAEFAVVSNPEFLREGAAIEDFKHPDRVVVGTEDERARRIMREIYRPLFINETPMLFTGRRAAELIKYAANAFLATKITFINEMADLCEKSGADVQEVARGMGLDRRIARQFLHAGPGFGGSCFPKDTEALIGDRPALRLADADRRNRDRGQYRAQVGDGRQDSGRLRRLAAGQDHRGAGPHVQAQHRRHARGAEPGDRAGPAGARRAGARLRSARHGGSPQADADARDRDRSLRLHGRRGRDGDPDRMGSVSRARSRPHEVGVARARWSSICATSTGRPTWPSEGFRYCGVGRG